MKGALQGALMLMAGVAGLLLLLGDCGSLTLLLLSKPAGAALLAGSWMLHERLRRSLRRSLRRRKF